MDSGDAKGGRRECKMNLKINICLKKKKGGTCDANVSLAALARFQCSVTLSGIRNKG